MHKNSGMSLGNWLKRCGCSEGPVRGLIQAQHQAVRLESGVSVAGSWRGNVAWCVCGVGRPGQSGLQAEGWGPASLELPSFSLLSCYFYQFYSFWFLELWIFMIVFWGTLGGKKHWVQKLKIDAASQRILPHKKWLLMEYVDTQMLIV